MRVNLALNKTMIVKALNFTDSIRYLSTYWCGGGIETLAPATDGAVRADSMVSIMTEGGADAPGWFLLDLGECAPWTV